MEITFKSQDGTMFGTTRIIGIGKKRPKLIYGEQAKKLREDNKLTTKDLGLEFGVKESIIKGIEEQTKPLPEDLIKKYMDKFKVEKEFFFDLDTDVYILGENGTVLKEFDNSVDCRKEFDFLMKQFEEGCKEEVKNFSMYIDFSKGEK